MLSLMKRFLKFSASYSTEMRRHITLYQHPRSPPCRAVIMAAELIEIDLELKFVEIRDCRTPEFQEINPFRTIPVLDDNGFFLSESRAINTYLSSKYGKDDSLYPKDIQTRAVVDQMLYFDLGILYQPMVYYWSYCVLKHTPHDEESFQRVLRPLEFFNETLSRSPFAAGQNFTLADVSLLASTSAIDAIGVDLTKYPNIIRWFERGRKVVPNYEEINREGVILIKEKLNQWKASFGYEIS